MTTDPEHDQFVAAFRESAERAVTGTRWLNPSADPIYRRLKAAAKDAYEAGDEAAGYVIVEEIAARVHELIREHDEARRLVDE